ncbi:MAG: response regulator [Alphaproteobacteria bacterium]|nr:response regulator [Alphaproteobacteria bacterium]
MAYNLQDIKILLVEDNEGMLDLVKAVLKSFGVGQVITALNGDIGFEEFLRNNPDLVIADWLMTPCDGLELSRMIRTDPASPNRFVPIILMTGFSEERHVISARDEGITEFLVKPFNTRDLYRRLYKIIESPRQFIESESFFGPDRRRRRANNYDGPMRRENDSSQNDGRRSTTPLGDDAISPEDIEFR